MIAQKPVLIDAPVPIIPKDLDALSAEPLDG
jgi:hypothetical protein